MDIMGFVSMLTDSTIGLLTPDPDLTVSTRKTGDDGQKNFQRNKTATALTCFGFAHLIVLFGVSLGLWIAMIVHGGGSNAFGAPPFTEFAIPKLPVRTIPANLSASPDLTIFDDYTSGSQNILKPAILNSWISNMWKIKDGKLYDASGDVTFDQTEYDKFVDNVNEAILACNYQRHELVGHLIWWKIILFVLSAFLLWGILWEVFRHYKWFDKNAALDNFFRTFRHLTVTFTEIFLIAYAIYVVLLVNHEQNFGNQVYKMQKAASRDLSTLLKLNGDSEAVYFKECLAIASPTGGKLDDNLFHPLMMNFAWTIWFIVFLIFLRNIWVSRLVKTATTDPTEDESAVSVGMPLSQPFVPGNVYNLVALRA